MKKLVLLGLIMINLLTACSSNSNYNEVETYNNKEVLYKKAVILQDAAAQFALGANYYFGQNGYTKDYDQAKKWFEASAKQGYTSSQYNLGLMYNKGEGVKRDYKKAIMYYEQAAQANFIRAQNNLGLIYYEGKAVPQDLDKAKLWFEKAANQGHLKSQAALASIYLLNDKNYPKGLELLKKGLKANNPQAQLLMGVLYDNGTAVSKDKNKAKKYYSLACKNGVQKACELSKNIH
ncbi:MULTISPECIES: tetratricopeptide repeat protein [unclassified Gilliamella]|uniref:tetratricopeptide repeat protein n=1 Tax=unclassified Gilliamella TaxID=2685620 RepID=UPI00226AD530|nr:MULTISPECIES: tetratricopeptide repeat protein [unclassified Gilliamella]MCX8664824.1 sel1 repeat family protein [Gilliamella sp. B2887]MCX8697420.1 sel1 repeat family protein [Gilliamella sp. B3000]